MFDDDDANSLGVVVLGVWWLLLARRCRQRLGVLHSHLGCGHGPRSRPSRGRGRSGRGPQAERCLCRRGRQVAGAPSRHRPSRQPQQQLEHQQCPRQRPRAGGALHQRPAPRAGMEAQPPAPAFPAAPRLRPRRGRLSEPAASRIDWTACRVPLATSQPGLRRHHLSDSVPRTSPIEQMFRAASLRLAEDPATLKKAGISPVVNITLSNQIVFSFLEALPFSGRGYQ
ncbi:uncharacterized protein LOC106027526 [Cavia porcellus]|uniref:uncharacterized protein LOC106027526 n=1 Tax=Cavia porcellus TaxID=10141 RepID=UPI002FE40151